MYERYAGLIFDMNGTILDTEPTRRKAWHEVLGYHGLWFDEHVMVALNDSPTWHIAQSIIELNHVDLDPYVLACEKTNKMGSMLLDSAQPLSLVDVMKAWCDHRLMSVGAGSESAIAEVLLAHLGLYHYFDTVVAADHIQHHRSAPDAFLLRAERMRVVPAHCVVFEDAGSGVQVAHAAGMDAMDVRSP